MPVYYYDGTNLVEVPASSINNYDGSAVSPVADVTYYNGSSPRSLWASATTVDDYEDGGISEYTGVTASFTTSSAAALEGSLGLELTGGSGEHYITSTSGLPAYPAVGDTIRANIRIDSATSGVLLLGFFGPDKDNMYTLRVDRGINEFGIRKYEAGSSTELGEVGYTYSAQTEYIIEAVPQSGGAIDARLLDTSGSVLATTSGQADTADGIWGTQGVTWYQWNGQTAETIYYDNIRIV